MTGPLQGHPGVDLATESAVVASSERAVIRLGSLLMDALISAPRAGLRFQLLTPPTSRLTVALAQALVDLGGQWVVRDAAGDCRDGFSGQPLRWDGSAFTPGGDPVEPPSPDVTAQGSISVDAVSQHPAIDPVPLGRLAEQSVAELTEGELAGWGVAEPVSQRWDRGEVAATCRARAPHPTQLLIVGGQGDRAVAGSLTVTRVDSGVRERTRLTIGCGDTLPLEAIERLAASWAEMELPPRTVLVGLEAGRSDGTVAAGPPSATVPYGFFLGPEVVAESGAERVRSAPVPAVALVGPEERPSAWVRLLADNGDPDPGGALAGLLAHLGVPAPGA